MGSNDNDACEALRELVGELALGDDAWLSDDERRRAEAHAADCPACRAYIADVAAIAGALRSLGEADVEVPERVLLESRYRILAAVRAKTIELRQQRLETAWRRRARLGWVACAAAGVVLLAIGAWAALSQRRRSPSPPSVAAHPQREPETVTPTPSTRITFDADVRSIVQQPAIDAAPREGPAWATAPATFSRWAEAGTALNALAARAGAARRVSDQAPGALEQVIADAGALRARWPDCREALDALALISRCYALLGEKELARAAFFAYADALGAQARARALAAGRDETEAEAQAQDVTANVIACEAARLFREKTHLLALSYCDVLVARYDGTEPGWTARVMVGQYYQRHHLPGRAVKAFRSVIQETPHSAAGMTARMSLPPALFKAGHQDEAVHAWVDYAHACPSEEGKANGYYNAGALLAFRGARFYPQAIAMYRKVLHDYPNTPCASVAQSALAGVEKEIERQILDL